MSRGKVVRKNLSQEMALEYLRYDAERGILTWAKASSLGMPAGSTAGSPTRKGYLTVRLFDTPYLVHRLAWFLTFGTWPLQIDHINGDRADNRLCNLRDVTNGQNQLNKPSRGTYFHRVSGRYIARTVVNGVRTCIGVFKTEGEAHQAYLRAHARYHGEHSFTQRQEVTL